MATLETSRALASNIYNVGKRIYLASTSFSSQKPVESPPSTSSTPKSDDDDNNVDQSGEQTQPKFAEQAKLLSADKSSEHNKATTNLLSTLTSTLNLFGQINLFSGSKIQQQNYQQLENITSQDDNSTEYLVYNWLENLFAKFQMIVIWQDFRVSLYAVCTLLSSYLLLTYFAPRFYAFILIALFIHNATKIWFRHVWPEIRVKPSLMAEAAARADINRYTLLHPNLMTLDELRQGLSSFVKFCDHFIIAKLLLLRQQKPIVFCSTICSFLYILVSIGDNISGYTMLFWILTIICIGPGLYIHFLSDEFKIKTQVLFSQMKRAIDDVEVNKRSTNDSEISENQEIKSELESIDETSKQSAWYLAKLVNVAQQPILNLLGLNSSGEPSKLLNPHNIVTSEDDSISLVAHHDQEEEEEEEEKVADSSSQISSLRKRTIKTSSSNSSMETFEGDYQSSERTSKSKENIDIVQDGFVIL